MAYELTKSFMEKHGKKKDAMKVNWITYIYSLNKKEKRN